MYKIGIFGGTFDPFTVAHLEIVKQALKQGLVDYVYICPTIVTWHRPGYEPWLDDESKVKVIKALLEAGHPGQCGIWCNDLNIRRMCSGSKFLEDKYVKEHRFVDTLLAIKSAYSADTAFYPIMGSDEYENFRSWYAYDSILKLSAGLIVATDESGNGRSGRPVAAYDGDPLFRDKVAALPIEGRFRNVSASELRKQFQSYENYIGVTTAGMKDPEAAKLLLHTPIFDVVRGEETESGLKPVLVKAPDWVSVVVEDSSRGKVLVETQFRYGARRDVREFPCGMVEPGEDPLDAALRELREETGIKVLDRSAVAKLGDVSPNPAFMTNTMHYFYVDVGRAKFVQTDQKLDAHEKLTYEWVDRDGFMAEIVTSAMNRGSAVPAMALAAVHLYGARQTGMVCMDEITREFDDASVESENSDAEEELICQGEN